MQIGDVVYLKSGGPPATVTEILTDKITVQWIVNGLMQAATLPPDAFTGDDPAPAITQASNAVAAKLVAPVTATPAAPAAPAA